MPTEKTLDENFQALVDSATYVQEPTQRDALLEILFCEIALLDAFLGWINEQLATADATKRFLRWLNYFGPRFETLYETYISNIETAESSIKLTAIYILVMSHVNKLSWRDFENFKSQFDWLEETFSNITSSIHKTLYFLKWNRFPEHYSPIMQHSTIHYWNLQGITLQGIRPARLRLPGANIANLNAAQSELIVCDLENSFNLASAKKQTLKNLIFLIDKIKTFEDLLTLYEKQKNGFLFQHQNSTSVFFSYFLSPPEHAQTFLNHLQQTFNRLLENNSSPQGKEKKALETLNTVKFATKIDTAVASSSHSTELSLLQ